MRKKLVQTLCAIVVGYLGIPAWAQAPLVQPLPDPTPLPNPTEGPPPPMPLANGGGPAGPSILAAGVATDPCACDRHGYWTVGGGFYYIKPAFESNPAFFTRGTSGTTTFFNQQNFDQNFEAAPLAFIGYTGANGLGVRGRWFRYDQSSDASTTVDGATGIGAPGFNLGFPPPPAGTVVTATSSLQLNVYDLEATYSWFHCRNSFIAALGVRYVDMSQDYTLALVNTAGTTTDAVSASSHFRGAGPTIAFEGRHQICSSCFAIYGTARGSLLFGSSDQNASVVGAGGAVIVNGSNDCDILPIGEIEVGGEWAKVCGKFRLFAQLGFVGQVWWGGGNASQAIPGSDSNGNFGFIGGVFRAGVNF